MLLMSYLNSLVDRGRVVKGFNELLPLLCIYLSNPVRVVPFQYALYCVLSITTALLHRRQGPMVLALTLFAALCELSLSASVGIMGLTFLSM